MKSNLSRLHQKSDSQYIAAADLGSNSFHLVITRLKHERLVVIDRIKEFVRLGGGLDEQSNLSSLAQQRAIDCLRRFSQRLQEIPAYNIRAVATNTFRIARNIHEFLPLAEEALGHDIDIISGREEARLIYEAVCYGLSIDASNQLVVDIGGGSTEIIAGSKHDPHLVESLNIGCVGLTKERFANGRISAQRMHLAELDAKLEIRTIQSIFLNHGWQKAIGCSGTIKEVSAALQYLGLSNGSIDQSSLADLKSRILDCKHTSELLELGFDEGRLEVIPGGFAIVCALFSMFDIEKMEISQFALREGVMYELLGRLRNQDVPERTVSSIVEHLSIDQLQAKRVQSMALNIFDQVFEHWFESYSELRNLLSWAALLHETGLVITFMDHHEHGAYLLEFSDMAGFSQPEQKSLAVIVGAHRCIWPENFASMAAHTHIRENILKRLCVVLRIAVLLHRPRTDMLDLQIKCKSKDNSLTLEFPSGWLIEHPLTLEDLNQEKCMLKPAGIALEFSASH